MVKEDKGYLMEILASCFHPVINPEARLNLKELSIYFEDKGLLYTTLVNIWSTYDVLTLDNLTLRSALIKNGNRTEAEANSIVAKIREYSSMSAEMIEQRKHELKELCFLAVIKDAQRRFPNNPVEYKKYIDEYQYRSLSSETFQIEDFDEIDVKALKKELLDDAVESSIPFINQSYAGHKGYLKKSLVMVVGAPKRGKSLFLMQEAAHFVRSGRKVHYLAIGDLNKLDFVVRQSAQLLHKRLDTVYEFPVENWNEAKEVLYVRDEHGEKKGRLRITCLEAMTITASNYYEVARTLLSEEDVLIVDYDYNFAHESDSMYERGGIIYNILAKLKGFKNQLIFIATQPKQQYWSEAFLGDEVSGESSQKQMIIDTMITLGGYVDSGTPCGWLNIPLQRRGKPAYAPYIRSSDGYLNQVPETLLYKYSSDKRKRELDYWDLQRSIKIAQSEEDAVREAVVKEAEMSAADITASTLAIASLQNEQSKEPSKNDGTDGPMSNE
jgi:hypothetical protein